MKFASCQHAVCQLTSRMNISLSSHFGLMFSRARQNDDTLYFVKTTSLQNARPDTPGSALSSFVRHPLPASFVMDASQTTDLHSPSRDSLPRSESESNESIINRKRELKALPSSFSSNLGRRNSPPRPLRGITGGQGSRSVKSIVAWLECSSSDSTYSKTSEASSRYEVPLSASSAGGETVYSQQTIGASHDVEEYSLTLLKYRKYFTHCPLARCLDEVLAGGEDLSSSPMAAQVGEVASHDVVNLSDDKSTPSHGPDSSPCTKRSSSEVETF